MGSPQQEEAVQRMQWTVFRQVNFEHFENKSKFKCDPDAVFAKDFKQGQDVYVNLKSNKVVGRGKAVEDEKDGRCTVFKIY